MYTAQARRREILLALKPRTYRQIGHQVQNNGAYISVESIFLAYVKVLFDLICKRLKVHHTICCKVNLSLLLGLLNYVWEVKFAKLYHFALNRFPHKLLGAFVTKMYNAHNCLFYNQYH